MKQLIFLFLFSVCAGFAHGQDGFKGIDLFSHTGETPEIWVPAWDGKPVTIWEAGNGVEIQESDNQVTIVNKKTVESDPEPTATIKGNGDLVITTPVTVGGQLDTIITKGNETWRIVATISAQQISPEEIDNQIRSIEAQIESIARQEQDLLKRKRRLNHGKKSKAKSKQ